jgi:hypothetical protein
MSIHHRFIVHEGPRSARCMAVIVTPTRLHACAVSVCSTCALAVAAPQHSTCRKHPLIHVCCDSVTCNPSTAIPPRQSLHGNPLVLTVFGVGVSATSPPSETFTSLPGCQRRLTAATASCARFDHCIPPLPAAAGACAAAAGGVHPAVQAAGQVQGAQAELRQADPPAARHQPEPAAAGRWATRRVRSGPLCDDPCIATCLYHCVHCVLPPWTIAPAVTRCGGPQYACCQEGSECATLGSRTKLLQATDQQVAAPSTLGLAGKRRIAHHPRSMRALKRCSDRRCTLCTAHAPDRKASCLWQHWVQLSTRQRGPRGDACEAFNWQATPEAGSRGSRVYPNHRGQH